jgi:hypothetical protein
VTEESACFLLIVIDKSDKRTGEVIGIMDLHNNATSQKRGANLVFS